MQDVGHKNIYVSVENQFPYFPLLYRQIIYDADKIEDWAVGSGEYIYSA
jgi:hypothetical protein